MDATTIPDPEVVFAEANRSVLRQRIGCWIVSFLAISGAVLTVAILLERISS